MDTNYTESEIRQKIENYKQEQAELKEKSTNVFSSWQAIIVYILLIILGVNLVLRLWRMPWGIGLMLLILFVLFAYGLPQMGKIIQANNQLKKRDKEKDKEIAKLHQMLENVMKK